MKTKAMAVVVELAVGVFAADLEVRVGRDAVEVVTVVRLAGEHFRSIPLDALAAHESEARGDEAFGEDALLEELAEAAEAELLARRDAMVDGEVA